MDQPKRGRGRPRRTTEAEPRKFYQITKTPLFEALLENGHIAYRKAYGKDGTDAAVIRWALNNVSSIR